MPVTRRGLFALALAAILPKPKVAAAWVGIDWATQPDRNGFYYMRPADMWACETYSTAIATVDAQPIFEAARKMFNRGHD